MIIIATLLQQVRYEVVVCSPKWDIRAVFFVGMLGGNRQEMLGGNNFHPASSRSSTHWKLTYSPTSKAMLPLHTSLWVFLNIDLHQNITIPFTNYNQHGHNPRLELVAMLDAGWNSTQHHCLSACYSTTSGHVQLCDIRWNIQMNACNYDLL